jgi:hypothetical protein
VANLTSLAQRLNDVEIDNNAPVSSQTFRRIGSDINYMLDYLGIDDGEALAGALTGLNVFSAPETFSYSYTFTNTDVGVPKTLFTFKGGGNRPLMFHRLSSGFGAPPLNYNFTTDASSEQLYRHPVLNLLLQLSTANSAAAIGQPICIIKCNAVEMARVTAGLPRVIQYSREINFAPAGVNTLTVTISNNLVASLPVSQSTTTYVAL